VVVAVDVKEDMLAVLMVADTVVLEDAVSVVPDVVVPEIVVNVSVPDVPVRLVVVIKVVLSIVVLPVVLVEDTDVPVVTVPVVTVMLVVVFVVRWLKSSSHQKGGSMACRMRSSPEFLLNVYPPFCVVRETSPHLSQDRVITPVLSTVKEPASLLPSQMPNLAKRWSGQVNSIWSAQLEAWALKRAGGGVVVVAVVVVAVVVVPVVVVPVVVVLVVVVPVVVVPVVIVIVSLVEVLLVAVLVENVVLVVVWAEVVDVV
jgi:hypothetical protein